VSERYYPRQHRTCWASRWTEGPKEKRHKPAGHPGSVVELAKASTTGVTAAAWPATRPCPAHPCRLQCPGRQSSFFVGSYGNRKKQIGFSLGAGSAISASCALPSTKRLSPASPRRRPPSFGLIQPATDILVTESLAARCRAASDARSPPEALLFPPSRSTAAPRPPRCWVRGKVKSKRLPLPAGD